MRPWQLTRTVPSARNWMPCSGSPIRQRLEESSVALKRGDANIPHMEVRRRVGLANGAWLWNQGAVGSPT
jgi:hypothetical protein